MNEDHMKMVEFDKYCETCRHKNENDEYKSRCDQCLSEPMNYESIKPVKYEED